MSPESSDFNKVHYLIHGYQFSQAIYVAAKLEIFNLLSDKNKTCEELASQCQISHDRLNRLLLALTQIDLIAKVQEGKFSLTSKGRLLSNASKNNLLSSAIRGGEENYFAWGKLLDGIKEDQCPFELAYKTHYFDYMENNIEGSKLYNKSMSSYTQHETDNISNSFPFSQYSSIIDVGGGYGYLCNTIAEKFSHVECTVFDTKSVIAQIPRESNDRCLFVSGNFLDSIPVGADIYILKDILHNWSDKHAIKILKNCHKAMSNKSKLLIIEKLPSEIADNADSPWVDLHMLVLMNGKQRTIKEIEKVLQPADLMIAKKHPTESEYQIIECECS